MVFVADVNLAYGKKVHYLGTAYRLNRRRGYKTLLTDGLVDVEDQECPTLAPGSAVEIDLNATYPIRSVVLQLNGKSVRRANGRKEKGWTPSRISNRSKENYHQIPRKNL